MIFDNSHLFFISSCSAYERRLTIFVFQLSIYAFCILGDEKPENEISSPRPGQRRSTALFAEGPISEVIGLTRAQELDFNKPSARRHSTGISHSVPFTGTRHHLGCVACARSRHQLDLCRVLGLNEDSVKADQRHAVPVTACIFIGRLNLSPSVAFRMLPETAPLRFSELQGASTVGYVYRTL